MHESFFGNIAEKNRLKRLNIRFRNDGYFSPMGSSDRSTPTHLSTAPIRGDPGASSSTLTPPLRAASQGANSSGGSLQSRRYNRHPGGWDGGGGSGRSSDIRRRNTTGGSPRSGSRIKDRIAEEDDEFPNRPLRDRGNAFSVITYSKDGSKELFAAVHSCEKKR